MSSKRVLTPGRIFLTFRRRRAQYASFTLVELLVVLTIIAILASLSLLAFNATVGAQSVVSSTYNAATYVEMARDEAISRQSYVWLGCQTITNSAGVPVVVLAAVASTDGSTNCAQANLTQIASPLRLSGMVLTNWSSLKATTRNLFTNGTPESVYSNTAGIAFQTSSTPFSGATVTFTPRGQALLKGTPATTDGYDPDIDISLRQAHGAVVAANADDAAVVIDGATGNPSIVRLLQ